MPPRRPGSAAGLPRSFVGVVIALLVLLSETLAAVRNAARDRVQVSFNLAFGSAMASIGLTIPAIAVASIWLDGPVDLGLGATQMVLLAPSPSSSESSPSSPDAQPCSAAACTWSSARPSCSSPPTRNSGRPPAAPPPALARPSGRCGETGSTVSCTSSAGRMR